MASNYFFCSYCHHVNLLLKNKQTYKKITPSASCCWFVVLCVLLCTIHTTVWLISSRSQFFSCDWHSCWLQTLQFIFTFNLSFCTLYCYTYMNQNRKSNLRHPRSPCAQGPPDCVGYFLHDLNRAPDFPGFHWPLDSTLKSSEGFQRMNVTFVWSPAEFQCRIQVHITKFQTFQRDCFQAKLWM